MAAVRQKKPLTHAPGRRPYAPGRVKLTLPLPLGRGAETQDAVVALGRGAATIAVVREDPQGAVGGLDAMTAPSGLALQERLLLDDVSGLVAG